MASSSNARRSPRWHLTGAVRPGSLATPIPSLVRPSDRAAFGQPGDILLTLSAPIARACSTPSAAHEARHAVIALTGAGGGRTAEVARPGSILLTHPPSGLPHPGNPLADPATACATVSTASYSGGRLMTRPQHADRPAKSSRRTSSWAFPQPSHRPAARLLGRRHRCRRGCGDGLRTVAPAAPVSRTEDRMEGGARASGERLGDSVHVNVLLQPQTCCSPAKRPTRPCGQLDGIVAGVENVRGVINEVAIAPNSASPRAATTP